MEDVIHIFSNFKSRGDRSLILSISLIPAIIFFLSITTGKRHTIDTYDELTFLILSVVILLWGVFTGLVSKKDAWRQNFMVKNAFLILCFSVAILSISISFWVSVIDPIKSDTLIYKSFTTLLFGSVYGFSLIAPPFLSGYILAKCVHIFMILFRKKRIWDSKS